MGRLDPERVGGHAGHRKCAGRRDQRHQAFQPHGFFRGGIGLIAETLVCEELARHDEAGPLARISQIRRFAGVDRVDSRLLDADGERGADLGEPGIPRAPMPGDGQVYDLLLPARQRPGRERTPQILGCFEQFRHADVGVVRPTQGAVGRLGCVVDARLLGVHVGAVDDGDAWHAFSPALGVLWRGEASIDLRVVRAANRNTSGDLTASRRAAVSAGSAKTPPARRTGSRTTTAH
jgi:hypothetical protein